MNKKYWLVTIVVGIIILIGVFYKTVDVKIDDNNSKKLEINQESIKVENKKQKKLEKPKMQIDQNKSYQAVLNTSAGKITLELFAKKTPITVNNFVYLAKNNFYDNTIFHRVIKNFMIQGGDPEGTGMGGPGYNFDDEPFEGKYTRGTLAMANSGPNTNGSQFFIMHKDYNLPRNYVIFGRVTDGLDTLDKIAEAPVKQSPSGENSQPVEPVEIKSVEVIEKL